MLISESCGNELYGRGYAVKLPALKVRNRSDPVQIYALRGLSLIANEITVHIQLLSGESTVAIVRRLSDRSFIVLHPGGCDIAANALVSACTELPKVDFGKPKLQQVLQTQAADGALCRSQVTLDDPTLGGLLGTSPLECTLGWDQMARWSRAERAQEGRWHRRGAEDEGGNDDERGGNEAADELSDDDASVRCTRPGPSTIDGWVAEIVQAYVSPGGDRRGAAQPEEPAALLVAAVHACLASRAADFRAGADEELIGVVEELVSELDAMGPEWSSLREVRPLAFTVYYLWSHIVIDQIADDLAMEVVRAATARLADFERPGGAAGSGAGGGASGARPARDRRPGAR